MNIEQCIGRSKQIPRTQHEQGYIDAICWLLQELKKRPVVVEQNADANTMNELHGEAYGVDWVYPAPSAPEGFKQIADLAFNTLNKPQSGYYEGLKLIMNTALAAARSEE